MASDRVSFSLSKTKVDKAGRTLAKAWSDRDFESLKGTDDFRVLTDYRRQWREPLLRVRLRLWYAANKVVNDPVVTQRHKREERIIRKLARTSTRLTQLQDIGGCRVVLPTLADAQAVCQAFIGSSSNDIHHVDEYLRDAQGYGYRAVHVIVREDGLFVEAQIRTRGQQEWAVAVEAIDDRLKVQLKDGEADPVLLRYFNLASNVIYLRESKQSIPSFLLSDFNHARRDVVSAGFYAR